MKRRRGLSPEEKALWGQVTRTVAPLPGKAPLPAPPAPRGPTELQPRIKPAPSEPALPKLPQSPLNAGDPKRERQVARGKIAIEGVLDLHGMRQDEADRATLRFLGGSLSRGRRVVLIITGKGGFEAEHKGEGRGILRRRFLQGIETGLYGQGISAVRPAHQRHGGQGAFYVFLKSKRHQTKADGVTKSSRRLSMRP